MTRLVGLGQLASVERVCTVADEYMAEDVHHYFESDARNKHNEQIAEHMTTLRQRFSDDDYLILSDPFIGLFEAFTVDLGVRTAERRLP